MNVYQTAMDIYRKRLQTENEDLLRDMAEATRLVQIPKGTVLFREGEVLRDCYCLVDGIVRIYYTMNDEEITESLRDDQGTILYPCVLINGVDDLANASIVSLSDCALLHIGVSRLVELQRAHPELERIRFLLVQQFVDRSFKLKRKLTHMGPTERYIRFLEQYPHLVENVPQKYIASFLGMTPVSLSRIRSKLKDKE